MLEDHADVPKNQSRTDPTVSGPSFFGEPLGQGAVTGAEVDAPIRMDKTANGDYTLLAGNDRGAPADSRLEACRQRLAGIMLGADGVHKGGLVGGSNGGSGRGEDGCTGDREALDDLRALRACLPDRSFSEDDRLEVGLFSHEVPCNRRLQSRGLGASSVRRSGCGRFAARWRFVLSSHC